MSEGISVGSVTADVVPDASGFVAKLRAQIIPEAAKLGDDVGATIAERITAKVRGALPEGLTQGTRGVGAQGSRAGDDFGGSFATTARRRIEAALASLPKPNIGVDATELDAELADIRARLDTLHDVRIGVDLRADDALAEIAALKARLDELGARSPDIRVKVDAAKAAAELAAVQAEVDHLDGKNVDIDTSAGVGSLSALATAGIALAPAIVPAAAAAAAAVAGIAAGAVAAGAGLGVLLIGLSGISAAVKELTQAHTANGAAAARSASQQVSAAAAVASAEQQLGDAHRAVADAERSSAQGVQQALASQQDAENTLATAQRDARQAQLDLSAARRQAKQDLQDLTLQVEDGALAQRQANLDVATARANLDKVLTNPASTQLQRQQAQLTYDQAVQQVTDLAVRQKRLQDQQAAATKAGVAGAAGVIAAQQHVSDTETALTRARREAAAAEAAVTEARRRGVEAILAANERVISAERQLQVAHASAGAAAVSSYSQTKKALDALSPAGQRFARFLAGLAPLITAVRDAVQTGLLPGLQAGITAILPALPALTGFLGGLARVMGTLFAQAGQALTAPFWTQFFAFLTQTVGPDLVITAHILGNFVTGLAGLFQAFAPVATQVGGGLERLSGSFATFGKNAKNSTGFQKFIAYLQSVGPKVAATIGSIVGAIAHIAVAAAPVGTVVLGAIKGFADVIRKIPIDILTALIAVLGPAVVVLFAVNKAVKAWAVVQAILNAELFTLDAIPVVALVVGIVAAVVLLVFGIIELVKHWSTVWATIKNVTEAVWRDVIKPVFDGIVTAGTTVYNWLKHNWPLLLAILTGPFGLAVFEIAKHWTSIRNGATTAAKWVTDKFNTVVDFFRKMPGRIGSAATGMWDGITGSFKTAINTIIGWWDSFVSHLKIPSFRLDSHIPGLPTYKFGGVDLGSHLQIPYLADGGMATAATLGVFGEAGREAILPLDNPNAIAAIRDALVPRGHNGPLVGELTINNPKAERASTSLPRTLRSTAFRLGYAS